MKAVKILAASMITLSAAWANAGDLTTDAAIGGAIGGAVGGALGAEVGGREGAILGAGVGAAAGTAISTKDHAEPSRESREHYDDRDYRSRDDGHHHHGKGDFCPPGQAKKGRC